MTIRISIITATYNSIQHVRSALLSVATQDYRHIEHLVIDGASTDGTLEYLKAYSGHPIRLYSEPDSGLYDALNKGIARATGDVIGFLHSDDVFATSSTITRVASAFAGAIVDGCYGDCEIVGADNIDRIIRRWRAGTIGRTSLARGWMPPHPTLFLRTGVYQSIGGFDTSFRISADYDFVLRLFPSRARTIAYIPTTLVKMRAGGTSQSTKNTMKKWREDLLAIRRNRIGGVSTLVLKSLRKIHQFV